MPYDLNDSIGRKLSVISANIDDEVVFLSISQDSYFGAGSIGARIWELIAIPTTLAAIVTRLQSEYDVDFDVCLADTKDFLEALVKADLAEWQ